MSNNTEQTLIAISNAKSYVALSEILTDLLIKSAPVGSHVGITRMIAEHVIVKAMEFGEDEMAKKVGYGISSYTAKLRGEKND